MSNSRSESPNSQSTSRLELTWSAILLGVVLSVIMGAANVYLGLRAGMTVSASIPAAVISMGILRGVLKRTSALESNLVQTAASAGESLAAGIIFTMPALLLTGVWQHFDFWTTTLIALTGGLLGVVMMIPMRQVFVIDNEELKFPEGVACAEVLRAGETTSETGNSGLKLILTGIGVGGLVKVLQSLVGLLRGTAEVAFVRTGRVFFFGAEISPALFSVGYIVTLPIALQIFAGGAIGWLIAIPLIGISGVSTDVPVDMAYEIWSSKVRYLGVGAMVVGGISSIWTVRGGLLAAARHLFEVMTSRRTSEPVDATEQNLSGPTIAIICLLCVLLIAGLYYQLLQHDAGLTILTTGIMFVMSFFFAAVASYIVGLVGNSNSPVSGMTITAVLGTGGLIMLFGFGGMGGIVATLGVAGVVCCVACTSGDVCNDLKTGHLVGASPRSQQIMQLIGIGVAAFVMAPVMTILHEGSLNNGTGGIGGKDLPAPQAGLFASLANGFFGSGELPKDMVLWGIGVGVLILIVDTILKKSDSSVRLHVMPVAVGIYLPFGLSAPILLGGIIRTLVSRRDAAGTETHTHRGTLMTSGIIAGESLVGVALGLFAYLGVASWDGIGAVSERLNLSASQQEIMAEVLSLSALLAISVWVLLMSRIDSE
ncbi:MAG: oligopeptide transporter, OPT family [Planctomycetaceae bacterium]|nr:oligopeptide transporter, OPT family [Planctomycetaceae bacterium]